MSALLNDEIVEAMNHEDVSQRLIITPLLDADQQIGPGSVDLRLGTEFLEETRGDLTVIDPLEQAERYERGDVRISQRRTYVPLGGKYVLHPGQFVLGSTLEFIVLPANVVGQVLSRSSWGRLGLLVATAVAVQPGYRGVLTLELVNTGNIPILLAPGWRVAQLQLWRSTSSTSKPYSGSGKYSSPLGPEGNKLAWEYEELKKLRSIGNRLHGLGAA